MQPQDLPAFTDVFDGLTRMLLARRLDDAERIRMVGDYFKALRTFPLAGVRAAAEVLAQRAKHFPKPVEWIEAIPRMDVSAHVPGLTTSEAAEWRAAERAFWEGEPCRCQACVQAQVDWKPIRFVPEFDADDRDRKVRLPEGRVVTAGHWAHGHELARYYAARAVFYNMLAERKITLPSLEPRDAEVVA